MCMTVREISSVWTSLIRIPLAKQRVSWLTSDILNMYTVPELVQLLFVLRS